MTKADLIKQGNFLSGIDEQSMEDSRMILLNNGLSSARSGLSPHSLSKKSSASGFSGIRRKNTGESHENSQVRISEKILLSKSDEISSRKIKGQQTPDIGRKLPTSLEEMGMSGFHLIAVPEIENLAAETGPKPGRRLRSPSYPEDLSREEALESENMDPNVD